MDRCYGDHSMQSSTVQQNCIPDTSASSCGPRPAITKATTLPRSYPQINLRRINKSILTSSQETFELPRPARKAGRETNREGQGHSPNPFFYCKFTLDDFALRIRLGATDIPIGSCRVPHGPLYSQGQKDSAHFKPRLLVQQPPVQWQESAR